MPQRGCLVCSPFHSNPADRLSSEIRQTEVQIPPVMSHVTLSKSHNLFHICQCDNNTNTTGLLPKLNECMYKLQYIKYNKFP